MVTLEDRLRPLDALQPIFEEQVEQFRDVAISRIDAVITPAYQALLDIARLGVIFEAGSPDIKSSFVGQQVWSIDAADSERFAPAGFVAIVSKADPLVWMAGTVVAYDRKNRQLTVQAVQAFGTTLGTRTGWSIYPAQPYHDQTEPGTKEAPVAGGGPIKNIYGSTTAGYVPAGSDIVSRSLFINWADGKLYWRRHTDGAVRGTAALDDLLITADKLYLAALIQQNTNNITTNTNNIASNTTNIASNTSAIAAHDVALVNRLRFDAGQVLNATQTRTVRGNLGIPAFLDALLNAGDAATARGAISAQDAIISAFMRGVVNQGDAASARNAIGAQDAIISNFMRGVVQQPNESVATQIMKALYCPTNKIQMNWDGSFHMYVDGNDIGTVWHSAGAARAVAYLYANNGYIRFPNGMTIMWGQINGSSNDRNVNYVTAFTFNPVALVVQVIGRVATQTFNAQIDNMNTGGFSVGVRYTASGSNSIGQATQDCFYIAIGYIA